MIMDVLLSLKHLEKYTHKLGLKKPAYFSYILIKLDSTGFALTQVRLTAIVINEYILQDNTIHMYSGITSGRVLDGELSFYTQRF